MARGRKQNIIQDIGLLVGHFLLARKHVQCFEWGRRISGSIEASKHKRFKGESFFKRISFEDQMDHFLCSVKP